MKTTRSMLAVVTMIAVIALSAGGADAALVGELGILDLATANGGTNPATGSAWQAGDTYRLTFVTSGTHDALSTNMATYDTFVQGAADAAGLGGTWQAIGSTIGVNSRTRLGMSGAGVGVFRLDSAKVADSYNDFWDGSFDNAIRINENGADYVSGDNRVWGGCFPSGAPEATRHLGSAIIDGKGGYRAHHGRLTETNGRWIRVYHDLTSRALRFYAVSDELTVAEAAAGPQLYPPMKIDFNSTNQDGGPHNQSGFEAYDAPHEGAGFNTKTYSAFGTTISVTPDWPNTNDSRVEQMIDRGAGNDNNWNNAAGDVDLVTDWLGIDTRYGHGNWDGTTGTPTFMTLALGGLPAGTYAWKSYHHDTENVHGDFAAWISTDGGATWEALADGLMTDSTSGGNPGSEGFTPPGPWLGPDADSLPSTYEFWFNTPGTDDVLLRFAPYANTQVHRQLWGINGFELQQVPEPATMALLSLAACGLGGYVRRRRRA